MWNKHVEIPGAERPVPAQVGAASVAGEPATTSAITALLHTRNRPDFVLRCLAYYNQWYAGTMVLLDASDDEPFRRLQDGLGQLQLRFPLRVLRHSASTPLCRRFSEALQSVSTPCVVLMADDDFQLPQGLAAALRHLQDHPDAAVAYGHTVYFEAGDYSPRGEVRIVGTGPLDPPARWLEADTPAERLRELGKGPWRTTGWYAVQRTDVLAFIVDVAERFRFSNELLERSMNLLQPIHGKVVKLDVLCLARQFNANEKRPRGTLADNEAALGLLRDAAVDMLSGTTGLQRAEAESAVSAALEPELAQLRHNDRALRMKAAAARLGAATAYEMLLRARRRVRRGQLQADQDRRLPAAPALSPELEEMRLLAAACR